MPTIAVLSMKGGVGKTTTSLGLASAAWARGLRVLVIDLDPQANATMSLQASGDGMTVDEALADGSPGIARRAVRGTGWGGRVDAVPAGTSLELRNRSEGPGSTMRLRSALAGLPREYDLVVIDCPPSIGELTRNGLNAATDALIVTEPAYYALHGAQQAMDAVDDIRATTNPAIRAATIVLNRLRPSVAEHRLRAGELRDFYGSVVSPTEIPERNAIPQSEGAGMPIHAWDSPAGRELAGIFDTLLDRYVPRGPILPGSLPGLAALKDMR